MTVLAEFQFLQPHWLWLLAPLWLLVLLHARHTNGDSMWQRHCDARLLAAMTAGQGNRRRVLLTSGLLGFVLSVGIIAIAAPSWSRVTQPLMEATSARVILLDLSRSMLVQDVRPSRFQHARAAASEILADDFAGETGLVVFAGSAFVLSPLSRDSASLLAFIDAINPSAMPLDGVNLSAAIDTGLELLNASFSGEGQLLLISAGDSPDDGALASALKAAAAGQRISVLAIGSAAGGPRLDQEGGLSRDAAGRIRISRGNFPLLQRIATAGNGGFAIAGASAYRDDLLNSQVQADELVESTQETARDKREAANNGAWLVWLLLPPALWLFRRNQLWTLMVVVLLPMPREATADAFTVFWNHRETVAFDAYRRGDYDRVRELSREPLVLGASYYHSGQFEQALDQFSEDNSATALYNQANTLVQLQRYPQALAAYQRALALDPGFGKARYNQRLLEHFLEQQASAVSDQGETAVDDDTGDPGDDDTAFATRIGIATELLANPADDPEIGSGSGASMQNGQIDPTERFSGEEAELERFVLRAREVGEPLRLDTIERWIRSLPETSDELYRRKFLRDYRRQQKEER